MSIKKDVICHAEGERCLGCKHYHDPVKYPVCEFAPPMTNPDRTETPTCTLCGGRLEPDCINPDCAACFAEGRNELANEYAAQLAEDRHSEASERVVSIRFLAPRKVCDTPLTVAKINEVQRTVDWQASGRLMADFARDLERQLAAARKDSERLRKLFIRAAVMAERCFDPGPIPPPAPTDADWEIADIIYHRETEQAIDAAMGGRQMNHIIHRAALAGKETL